MHNEFDAMSAHIALVHTLFRGLVGAHESKEEGRISTWRLRARDYFIHIPRHMTSIEQGKVLLKRPEELTDDDRVKILRGHEQQAATYR